MAFSLCTVSLRQQMITCYKRNCCQWQRGLQNRDEISYGIDNTRFARHSQFQKSGNAKRRVLLNFFAEQMGYSGDYQMHPNLS